MNRAFLLLAAAGPFVAPICAGFAAQPTSPRVSVQDPGSLILDQGRSDRTPAPTPDRPKPQETPGAPVAVAVRDEGANVTIRGIAFEGTKVPAIVARAAEPFVGRKADRKTLGELATAMSDAYAHANVALYTVAVPQQDFANGRVRLLVLEGHVEAVKITGDARDRAAVEALAAGIKAETPLSRATLERNLSLMRDIPGLKVDVQLLTGSKPGAVVLAIKLDHQKQFKVDLGFDNRTQRLLDDGQFTAGAHAYGLLREGDQTDLVAASGVDLKSFRYVSLAHSTPVGVDGARLSLSAGTLSTRQKRTRIHGDAQVAGISLSYPLIRSYATNLVLTASLDGLNSDNALLGSTIAKEHTRAARGSAGFSISRLKRSITAGVTVSRGLDILGARTIEPLSETTFTKVNGRVTLDQAIGKRIIARLRASGQYSDDRLPAGERFAIGGEEFGRAFETAIITADRGYAGLAELAFKPLTKGKLAQTEIYTFIDGARVRLVPRGLFTGATYDLASAGGGVRLAYTDKAAITVEGARSLDDPFPLKGDWRVSVGWRLSLRK